MKARSLPICVAAFLAAGCGLFNSDPADGCHGPVDPILGCLEDPGREITITLTNADDEAVHLFVGAGETFPCCRVEPGASRSTTTNRAVGGLLSLEAGRNGQVINSRFCIITQQHFDSRSASFTWDGAYGC